jgi:hypothetical protein
VSVPADVARWLDLVNAMPPEPEWKPLAGLRAAGAHLSAEKRPRLLGPAYAAVIDTYPPSIKRFFGPLHDFTQMERRYAELERARGLLTEIASVNASQQQKGPLVLPNTHLFLIACIDEKNGHLKTEVTAPAFLTGVDLRRVRRCMTCGKVFWAGRLDRECCSPACSLVWRSRKWRKAHSGE